MGKIIKLSPNEGKIIDFEVLKEAFGSYLLADGNTLKLKVVLLKVKKTDKKAPDGSPIYNFNTHLAATVNTSDEMRWKGGN